MRALRPLILAAALVLLVPAAASAQRTISTEGSVSQLVPNDSARVGFAVAKQRRSRQAALAATSRRLRAVIAAAQGVAGVGAGDVVTGRISVRRVDLAPAGRPSRVAFRAREGVRVTLHDSANAGALINAGLSAGATSLSGPDFFAGDQQAAYRQALDAAFDQAKAKAQELAVRAGGTLGQVLSIEEQTSVTAEQGSGTTNGASGGKGTPTVAAPVKPGQSQVNATVRVVFELD